MPRVLILGDAAAFHGINPRFYKDAESFAAPSFSIDDQLHILQRLLASGAKPRCILGAFSFGGTMEPELGAAEVKALGELLSLAKNQEIPFILLKVPFGKLVPAEESVSYWIKYEELLLASNGPFRLFAPPALPEEDFVDRRRVTYEGAKKIAAYLEPALVGTCYR